MTIPQQQPSSDKHSGIKFAAAVLMLSLTSTAWASQVLQNPGFESGTIIPWSSDTRYAKGTGLMDWTVIDTGCHTGNFCAVDTGNIGLLQTFAAISTTNISDISFYSLHPDGNVDALAYDFFYSDGTDVEFLASDIAATWTLVDATAHLRTNADLTGFEIFGFESYLPDEISVINGITMVDDVSITTSPEPTMTGLLLTGLFVVAVGERRVRES